MHTVAEFIDYAVHELQALESARLDSELLLADLMREDRSFLYAHPEHELDTTLGADFRRLIRIRQEGFPIAYITGHREFWSLQFSVNEYTLIPRPETELLVELALAHLQPECDARVLDLCTGSGAIAVSLGSERPSIRITATDICKQALAVASTNMQAHGIDNIELLHSDLFSSLAGRRFDAILCNPPYISSTDDCLVRGDVRHEPRLALDGGHQGFALIREIAGLARDHLSAHGFIILEHGNTQGTHIRELLLHLHYTGVETFPDAAGHERATIARMP